MFTYDSACTGAYLELERLLLGLLQKQSLLQLVQELRCQS
jgi:hypothetical protein